MFLNTKPTEPLDIKVNPKYKSSETLCRDKVNEIYFIISEREITVNYNIIAESVINCDIVASATLNFTSDIVLPTRGDEALICIIKFLKDIYHESITCLKDTNNIPENTFLLIKDLKTESDLELIAQSIFLKLKNMGLYV